MHVVVASGMNGVHHVVHVANEDTPVGEVVTMGTLCGIYPESVSWIIAITPGRTVLACGTCYYQLATNAP